MNSETHHRGEYTGENGYVYAQITDTSGLGHLSILVQRLLILAYQLNRIALVPSQLPFRLHHTDNAPVSRDTLLYFDLDKSMIDDNGKLFPVRYKLASSHSIDKKRMKVINNEKEICINENDNTNSPEIFCYLNFFTKLREPAPDTGIRVLLEPGASITPIRDIVLRKMFDRAGTPLPDGELPKVLDFCCIKVRRRDKIMPGEEGNCSLYQTALRRAITSAKNVKANMRERGLVDDKTIVYLMSDEPNRHFFDSVRAAQKHYYDCHDFPELHQLSRHAEGGEFNNFLLFAIEKEIYNSAAVTLAWELPGEIRAWALHGRVTHCPDVFTSRDKFRAPPHPNNIAPNGRKDYLLEQAYILPVLCWRTLLCFRFPNIIKRILKKIMRTLGLKRA